MHTVAAVLSHDRTKSSLFGWGAVKNLGVGENKQLGAEGNLLIPTKIAADELSNREPLRLASIFAGMGDHTFVQLSDASEYLPFSPPTLFYFTCVFNIYLYAPFWTCHENYNSSIDSTH